jgi:hypothetical protein
MVVGIGNMGNPEVYGQIHRTDTVIPEHMNDLTPNPSPKERGARTTERKPN